MSIQSRQSNVKKIYIDIDTLFDLRLGTLAYIDPDFAVSMMVNPDYYQRNADSFTCDKLGKLDVDLYKQVLDTHGDAILRNSLPTRIPIHIVNEVHHRKTEALTSPYYNEVKLELNIYPFNISEEEKELFKLHLADIINDKDVSIDIINRAHSTFTVQELNADYLSFTKYDASFIAYLEEDLKKGRIEDTIIYLPKVLLLGKTIPEEVLKEFAKYKEDIFHTEQACASTYCFRLIYLPTAYFSANTPENKNEYL